jgi:hypothetical protein
MRFTPRADDMRTRSRQAVGLSEVQEGWEAPGSDAAPACAAPATSAAARRALTFSADEIERHRLYFFLKGTSYKTTQMNLLLGGAEQ